MFLRRLLGMSLSGELEIALIAGAIGVARDAAASLGRRG
jgi:hypothetical protein